MLYSLYELGHLSVAPMRIAALMQASMLRSPFNPIADTEVARTAVAASDLFETVTRRYRKPNWGLAKTLVNGVEVAVTPTRAWSSPWCEMIHFARDEEALRSARGRRTDPTVLIVAPMSGHHATLLRGTVAALMRHHDVIVTDWVDAKDVPFSQGHFDLDDYVDHIVESLQMLGPGTHVIAVCQPSVPALAAAALMAAADDPARPRSLTLMGGPIDTRVNPTRVNQFATSRSLAWFERSVVSTVPFGFAGVGRAVYPGFMQLSGFMSMNIDRHVGAHLRMFEHLIRGDGDSAEAHRRFYDEYMSVMDLTAEFYLQTVDTVFVRHLMPRGLMRHRGRPVDLAAISRPALMTVEGERDDITGTGQCRAAHNLCTSIAAEKRAHFECPRVGHYGIFNGQRFRAQIAPRMAKFMRDHDPCASTSLSIAQLEHMAKMPQRGRRGHEFETLAFAFSHDGLT